MPPVLLPVQHDVERHLVLTMVVSVSAGGGDAVLHNCAGSYGCKNLIEGLAAASVALPRINLNQQPTTRLNYLSTPARFKLLRRSHTVQIRIGGIREVVVGQAKVHAKLLHLIVYGQTLRRTAAPADACTGWETATRSWCRSSPAC